MYFRYGRREVGIFLVDGRIYAILNVCPHQLAPVCQGIVAGQTSSSRIGEYNYDAAKHILRCPWHGYEFDLSTGTCLVDDSLHVAVYPIEVVGRDVVIYV